VPRFLHELLPQSIKAPNDVLLGHFLDYVTSRQLTLYPAQEAALLELFDEKNVILNTPTGSGKSLVAAGLHFKSLAQGTRSIYSCPVKALVNEKWMALCREFGPENVGLSTGDATVNREAPILCCTAEILANIALREGRNANLSDVVMDEFHYYSDRDRGGAWQVPLLTLPQCRFLLMSATLGSTGFFEEELTRLNGKATVTVSSLERPVPLEFAYSELALAATLEQLLRDGKGPVYVVHFTRNEAAESAQDFTSINVCTREQKLEIAGQLEGASFASPYGPEVRRWLKHGIGLHHSGLLPRYRVLVEQLAQKGLLKVICGTDTLGVGINVPIRTVLFSRLCKFDGEKMIILTARDFHQIAGRAGRKGFDERGWVVAQAPEHMVANLKAEGKASRDGKNKPRQKAPEKNFVNWDKKTFARLMTAPPEPLVSRFQVTHAMLLNVLGRRNEDGCRAMQRLILSSHETPKAKKNHSRRAWQLFRSLLERKIVEIVPDPANGHSIQVNVDLQENFSMDQTLSLYLHETLSLVDPESPQYALVLLSLVESILEDPDAILRRQLDKLKSAKMAEMKQEGIEYEKRIEELEKLEYPKPEREFIYSTFNAFAQKHPWVGQENIRPKSIAREMFENFRSFPDYIRDYELQRAEGILLRHLHSVYKVLIQTVPEMAKNDTVREMEIYFGTMLRQTDSSLLDEWEKLRRPDWMAPLASPQPKDSAAEAAPKDIVSDAKTFIATIRHRIFSIMRFVSRGEMDLAIGLLDDPLDQTAAAWTPPRLASALEEFQKDHERINLDPEARNIRHTHILPSDDKLSWKIQQVLVDPQGHNDWMLELSVDLIRSRDRQEPWLQLLRFGKI
jgi:superfamily II RNA helicase